MGNRGGFRPASAKIPTEKCRPRVQVGMCEACSPAHHSWTLAPTKNRGRRTAMNGALQLSTAACWNSHSYAACHVLGIHLTRSATAPTGISKKLHPAAWWGGVVVAMSQSRLQVLQWQ